MNIMTGYYGVPGSNRGAFTVHFTIDGRPACGWKPRADMRFQWCAHGIHWDYLECEKCKRLAAPLLRVKRT